VPGVGYNQPLMDMTERNQQSTLRITVFGGSQPKPGDLAYQEALNLGKLIGARGWTVLTGGYIGTMEAVSRGAAEAGGHVIGVTCDEIESWRPVVPNRWVQEEMRYPTLRQRLYALIDGCDVALALPGGIGTLAEVAVMWSQLQTGASVPRPLILIGLAWKNILDTLMNHLGQYFAEKDRKWLFFADDVDQAVKLIDSF
jgi:uncharacterized protein (TIGR00730 family)